MPEEIIKSRKLKELFESSLTQRIPGIFITGKNLDRLVNTSHVRFEGIESETFLIALDQRGLYASSGSACMSGAQEPSYVLKAMGLSEEEADSAVRFSFGRFTDETAVLTLMNELKDIVHRLRSFGVSKEDLYQGVTAAS